MPLQFRRLASLLLFLAAPVAGASDGLRWYQSVPAGTELGQPGWPSTQAVWLERIEAARRSIELSHFYASDRPGSRLEAVVEALERAAARGVAVRFLADAKFQATYPETLTRLGEKEGIEVRLYDLSGHTGGVMHAKYMLVDARYVCLGSANFDWRALEHIQELGLELDSEPLARAFGQIFAFDWALAGGEPAPEAGPLAGSFPVELRLHGEPVRVTPVFSPADLLPPGAAWDLPHLVETIDTARERVSLQLLSYQTTDREGRYFEELESALRRAAARGCEVRLLLADWSKRRWTIEGLQSLQALPRITVRLLSVPEAPEGFIPFARVAHPKYLVCDGRHAWVGSSNWSRDYFHSSRNAGVLLEGAAAGRALEEYFRRGFESEHAETVDPGARYTPPRIGE